MSRLLRFVLFLFLFGASLLLARPADAHLDLVGDFRTDPAHPVDSRPTILFVTGNWPCCSGPTSHRVDVDPEARTVDVVIEGPGDGTTSLVPWARALDLGLLPAGEYDVSVTVFDVDADAVVGTRDGFLSVGHGMTIVAPTTVPTADQPVDLVVRGLAPCPVVDVESVGDGFIRLEYLVSPCVPAPPTPFETTLRLFLDPDHYDVELRDLTSQDRLLSTLDLTVLPWPTELQGGRFTVEVEWTDFEGETGVGRPTRIPSSESAQFWFFSPTNEELMVKVLDGCSLNDHWWVFGAATTTVEFEVRVTDRETGAEWTFENPAGLPAEAFTETEAFACR